MVYIRLKSTGKVHEVDVPDKCIDKYIYVSKDGIIIKPNDIVSIINNIKYPSPEGLLLHIGNILSSNPGGIITNEINIQVAPSDGPNPIYKIKSDETGSTVFQPSEHKQNIIISHDASSFTFDAQNSAAPSSLFMLNQAYSSVDKQFTMNNFKFINHKQYPWFYLLGSVTLTLSGAHFENNSYTPIVSQGDSNISTLNLTNCDAYNNGNVAYLGGFVNSSKTTINMKTTDPSRAINNNKALQGGVFYLEDSSLNITYDLSGSKINRSHQIFVTNHAEEGGVIYAYNSHIDFSGSTGNLQSGLSFWGNHAENGGIISLYNNSSFNINSLNDNKPVTLTFNRIKGEISLSGGAIYSENRSTIRFNTEVMMDEYSAIEGGGIYMQNGVMQMDNVYFNRGNIHVDNVDKDILNGGAIYARDSSINITTLTVYNSIASKGAILYLGQNTNTKIDKLIQSKNSGTTAENKYNLIYIETPKPSNRLIFQPPETDKGLSSIIYPQENSKACGKGCQDTGTAPNYVTPIKCLEDKFNNFCSVHKHKNECIVKSDNRIFNCYYDGTMCLTSKRPCLDQ